MSAMVLVLNCGSSSIKYQLIDADDGSMPARGLAERIGENGGHIRHEWSGEPLEKDVEMPDHEAGLAAMLDLFEQHGPRLSDVGIRAVGHRVVHGGETFAEPVTIDDDVERTIDELSALAPLHNPPNLAGITVARRALSDLPHVAVFDTAFHQSLPPVAYTYALDRDVAAEHHVRRYGFHGTSVSYVTRETARLLNRDPARTNIIVLHLGNGASATAIRDGASIDTSMGLTPLQGLVMGSRSGDLDPGILFHLRRSAGMSVDELDDMLNRHSGVLGLTGVRDMREVHQLASDGDDAAKLARDIYCYRIRQYVGAYLATLGEVHAVVFTGGVGENDSWVRSRSLAGMRRLGIEVDHVRNASRGSGTRFISPDGASTVVAVVPTNEELEIARQTMSVVDGR
ncbi:acetate kinase [Actinobacteria bacterium YIM 96077]|uniref:Acetate kinase n=1 Tax=Phytoactinopolyspora halophila TaxID=1981511 RepID=A0A329QHJ9_9ACTN|nr:acetate kinase [Phytoactinopolyspora halophila]AYY14425.1 acetate kinase [Actinobacteria bacterium YIM 96077]RAW11853.1 acetate kinase [Phytoactinopolyspora halophila]